MSQVTLGAGTASIEEANEFLGSYLKKFNKQFALHKNTTKSVFETQPSAELVNQTNPWDRN